MGSPARASRGVFPRGTDSGPRWDRRGGIRRRARAGALPRAGCGPAPRRGGAAPADVAFAGLRKTAPARVNGDAEPYKRYLVDASGVSPMAIPGTPGAAYTADGLEHNERGIPSSGAADHSAQLDKRERKLAQTDFGARWADIEGDGPIAVVTFGSTTGAAREAVERARADGIAVRLV